MKVAKLVYLSLMTRVIVDENATYEDIVEAVRPNFRESINDTALGENIEEIIDDEEIPFGELDSDIKYIGE
jgi:hypothetical protein